MKKLTMRLAKWLMRIDALRIEVFDDKRTYFNEQMLSLARTAGYANIQRGYKVDAPTLQRLLDRCPDIIILDVKGVTDPAVAKDGLAIAARLKREARAFVAVTSAHQYHLRQEMTYVDHVIEDRLLTAVDFIEELDTITERYLSERLKKTKKVAFRAGFSLARKVLTS